MWIKRTRVQTRTSDIRYLQLMRTEYRDGKSRQKVILNLGHEEDINREHAELLARSISNDHTYDFIAPEAMALLPSRLYGEVHILMKLFEITSMQRFCLDAAHSRSAGEEAVQAIFALLCYYLLSYGDGSELEQWASRYYLPDPRGLDREQILKAVGILVSVQRIHPGIATLYRKSLFEGDDQPLFTYCCETRYTFGPDSWQRLSLFTVNSDQLPLSYREQDIQQLPATDSHAQKTVLIGESPMLQQLRNQKDATYLIKIAKSDVRKFFEDFTTAQHFAEEGGSFSPFRDYGYRVLHHEGKQVIILAGGHGELDPVQSGGPARDILVSNCTISTETLLSQYLLFLQMSDISAEIHLPKDLAYLKSHYNDKQLMSALLHLQSIQLFLISFLENKLQHEQSFEAVMNTVQNIRIAKLQFNTATKLIHTRHTPLQENLLNTIAFR